MWVTQLIWESRWLNTIALSKDSQQKLLTRNSNPRKLILPGNKSRKVKGKSKKAENILNG